jgi:hypothetical protein
MIAALRTGTTMALTGALVETNGAIGIPFLRLPLVSNLFKSNVGGMAVLFHVKQIVRMARDVHVD